MQNKLKIMTWNIRGGATLGWGTGQQEIKAGIVNNVIGQKADIIVLTEFIITIGVDYILKQLQEKYIWFQASRTGKNGILIAINKELVDCNEKLKEQVWYDDIVSSQFEGCNILKITLPLKCGKKLSIIGCRMETGINRINNKNLKMQYDNERTNFDKILIPMIRPLKKGQLYIVCGDFNNARCLGKLNEKFNSQNYNEKAHCNYNLNIIKDTFDDIGFTMVDITENGDAIMTHKKQKYTYPDDHIFVYGFRNIGSDTASSKGLSDHDILWAEVMAELD